MENVKIRGKNAGILAMSFCIMDLSAALKLLLL